MYPCRRAILARINLRSWMKFHLDRGFRNDVGDHSGGVFMMTKKSWEKIGGLNPLYVGWGLEDNDTRQRVREWFTVQR